MQPWLLLVYKVPPKPTSSRVYVWRKLKKLGALLWHDAVWILPATPRTREHFQWLAAEIKELGGEVQVWQADTLLPGQEEALVRQFESQADEAYQAVLAGLKEPKADYAAASRAYLQVQQQDYFGSAWGPRIREELLNARKGEKEE
ncbi:Chromate resistance protein ChrB [Paenibacillus mucilaginosus]|uniref:ChrB protein n=3 Tax=Paenibacillus mucilaginosus TaxID=61624 RepID=H6NB26_9BACL|nr:Chromate resistance protein ChrB [Paenibacillus mucilaginosus]AEI43643.1 ChrB protein [Paenibacillus mucilaginosus KNP414]AFC31281.1 ChrB protein [Paenibacillus mucilaginosus 3016]AFH63606.1 ChrB protein [Paenibacillus mucilaginosus K02]MCG7216710.1 ChrB protein [Paenibacillus mucilaginosus]WDM25173.1 ChrB protein [Paenibacillus mucilaginosus]